MPADGRPARRARRGFVFGELLVALLLLIVAVSSLAALMYSVSRRPAGRTGAECAASEAALGKCVPEKPAMAPTASPASKLLRSGCATLSVYDQRNCKDTVTTDGSDETIVRARTDSASLGMIAKKAKPSPRTDRGFIR
jgi:hypothetical protein